MMIDLYERIQRGFFRQLNNKDLNVRFGVLFRLKCDLEDLMRNNDFSTIENDVLGLKGLIDKEIELTEKEVKCNQNEEINKIVELQKEFKSLYPDRLISIHSDRVHVTPEFFILSFEKFDVEYNRKSDYPYKLKSEYKGVDFFTVMSTDSFEKLEDGGYVSK